MISIVIPAYNEQDSILATVNEINTTLDKLHIQYEIIVVNDGSSDETQKVLSTLNVTAINHPHNIGYGASLKDGICKAQYDTIVITDADQTYPFTEVPRLLAEYEKGFDMVVAARTGEHYRESMIKSPLRKILQFLVEYATSRKVPDVNSGLRIFSKSTISQYLEHLCDTFSFTTSLTIAYMMTAKYVSYLPITYAKRAGKTKVRLVRDSLRTLQYILQAINYYDPLKIFILFAILCIICSGIGFSMSSIFGLKSGFLLGIGGLLVSLVILGIGLLADLLKQIMNKSSA